MNSSNPIVSPPGRRTDLQLQYDQLHAGSARETLARHPHLDPRRSDELDHNPGGRSQAPIRVQELPHGRWPCCSVNVGYFWVNVSFGSHDDPTPLGKGPNQQSLVPHITVPTGHQDTITNPQRPAASTSISHKTNSPAPSRVTHLNAPVLASTVNQPRTQEHQSERISPRVRSRK